MGGDPSRVEIALQGERGEKLHVRMCGVVGEEEGRGRPGEKRGVIREEMSEGDGTIYNDTLWRKATECARGMVACETEAYVCWWETTVGW